MSTIAASLGKFLGTYLEQLVQKGDVIGPFLEGCVEEGQDFVNSSSIPLIVLVLDLGFF